MFDFRDQGLELGQKVAPTGLLTLGSYHHHPIKGLRNIGVIGCSPKSSFLSVSPRMAADLFARGDPDLAVARQCEELEVPSARPHACFKQRVKALFAEAVDYAEIAARPFRRRRRRVLRPLRVRIRMRNPWVLLR